jgi:uncharacterized membrane protein
VGNRWGTGRLEAFSDGVFAIAITLLVLDINIPASEFHHLWHAIKDEWPSYLGFATSFITIGGVWMAHHGAFRRMQYANDRIMRINLLLLMAVSFLPFPTRLVAEAINDTDAERTAVVFYGACLLVIALLISALWREVAADRTLLRPEVSQAEVDRILVGSTHNIGFYVGVNVLAVLAPRVAAFGYLVIAVVSVLRAHGDADVPAPATAEPT